MFCVYLCVGGRGGEKYCKKSHLTLSDVRVIVLCIQKTYGNSDILSFLSGRRAKVQIITPVATEDWDYMAALRFQLPTR